MDAQNIKALLNKYDNALTSAAEERLLEAALGGDVPEELAGEATYFMALHGLRGNGDDACPGLAGRLSRQVDRWNAVEKSSGSRARRMSLRVVSMVAASLLLLFSLGIYLNSRHSEPAVAAAQLDTFSNPEDASAAAGKALAKFSLALNKGLGKMNRVNIQ